MLIRARLVWTSLAIRRQKCLECTKEHARNRESDLKREREWQVVAEESKTNAVSVFRVQIVHFIRNQNSSLENVCCCCCFRPFFFTRCNNKNEHNIQQQQHCSSRFVCERERERAATRWFALPCVSRRNTTTKIATRNAFKQENNQESRILLSV